MKVGRVAMVDEEESGGSAGSRERRRPVTVTVAVHVRLGAVEIWRNQGAIRV